MKTKLLIVDDNLINLKLACEVLACDNYEVMQANGAAETLERIGQARPDLILMDIAMPGMDGMELTRLLKSREDTRGIPIIAMTAFAMKGDEEKVRAAGCDGYIPKPISTRTIAGQLSELLRAVHHEP